MKNRLNFILGFLFFSGALGLIYEILWFKELTIIFGNTAYATSAVLAAFFLGLATGGYVCGKLRWGTKTLSSSLLAYFFLECGIGVFIFLYVIFHDVYFDFYYTVLQSIEAGSSVILLIKFLLSLSLLFIPTFLMGGTLPILGRVLSYALGNKPREDGTMLYALNTFGGVFGVFIAGFYMPMIFGFKKTFALAASGNILLAFGIYMLYRYSLSQTFSPPHEVIKKKEIRQNIFLKKPSRSYIYALIFLSGFATLALEVLWTHMLLQEIVSDVYSFSLILGIFLTTIACGALLSRRIMRQKNRDVWFLLHKICAGASILIAASPLLFIFATHVIIPWANSGGFTTYILISTFATLAALGIPTLSIGLIFPLLLYAIPESKNDAGNTIGNWTAANTVGAVFGAILAAFILLPFAGLINSILIIASIYLTMSYITIRYTESTRITTTHKALLYAFSLCILIFFYVLPGRFAMESYADDEISVAEYYGAHGIVSVVESHPSYYPENINDLYIRLNRHTTLGGTGSSAHEKRQAHLPLFLHDNPKRVFILGLGTGITAGAALSHPIEKLSVAELVPEVIMASQEFFTPFVNNLFSDERARVIFDDGRNYMLHRKETYDVIISDLFHPWTPGTAYLYTKEHFELIRKHLGEEGLFAQWLPLYQLSEKEFSIIAKTFLEVFPESTLWRGNFETQTPTVLLIGAMKSASLNPDTLVKNVLKLNDNAPDELIDFLVSTRGLPVLAVRPQSREFLTKALPRFSKIIPFTLYAGNLSEYKDAFKDYPINTDDKPIVEYLSPQSLIASRNNDIWLSYKNLELFFDSLARKIPLDNDPYLALLSPAQKNYVRAGLSYYRFAVNDFDENAEEANKWFSDYLKKTGLEDPNP